MKRVIKKNINPVPCEELGRHFNRWDWRAVYNEIRNIIVPSDVLLDVGSGGGREIRTLREQGMRNEIHICDYFQENVDFLMGKPELKIRRGFVCDMNKKIRIRPYDVIICSEVIEHLEEPIVAIKKLLQYTQKCLIVTCPFENANPQPQHIWSISKEDLKINNRCVVRTILVDEVPHLLAVYYK